jgi:hypothetical protein
LIFEENRTLADIVAEIMGRAMKNRVGLVWRRGVIVDENRIAAIGPKIEIRGRRADRPRTVCARHGDANEHGPAGLTLAGKLLNRREGRVWGACRRWRQ